MDRIDQLARHSVLRASGFAGIAILMVMMGTLHDPPAAFRNGAVCLLILSACMWAYARAYHMRRDIRETEVWIMLHPDDRPSQAVARGLIVAAMRRELAEKATWWAMLALLFLGCSALLTLLGR